MIYGSSLSVWSGGMLQQRRPRRALRTLWLRGSWTPRAQNSTRARAPPQKLLQSMPYQQAHPSSWPAKMGAVDVWQVLCLHRPAIIIHMCHSVRERTDPLAVGMATVCQAAAQSAGSAPPQRGDALPM